MYSFVCKWLAYIRCLVVYWVASIVYKIIWAPCKLKKHVPFVICIKISFTSFWAIFCNHAFRTGETFTDLAYDFLPQDIPFINSFLLISFPWTMVQLHIPKDIVYETTLLKRHFVVYHFFWKLFKFFHLMMWKHFLLLLGRCYLRRLILN